MVCAQRCQDASDPVPSRRRRLRPGVMLLLCPLSARRAAAFMPAPSCRTPCSAIPLSAAVSHDVTPYTLQSSKSSRRLSQGVKTMQASAAMGWGFLGDVVEEATAGPGLQIIEKHRRRKVDTSVMGIAPPRSVEDILRQEFPDANPEALVQLLRPSIRQAPGLLENRVRFLKTTLVGCNVTSLLLSAPRLAWGLGSSLESRMLSNYQRLQEVLSPASAAELVGQMPRLLLRDFKTRTLPHIHLLLESLSPADVGYVLRKNPHILTRSVSRVVRPQLELIRSCFRDVSADNFSALFTGEPELLTMRADMVTRRVEELKGLLPHDLVLPTLVIHPRTWHADLSEVVGPQVALLRARLSEQTLRSVLGRLPSVLYLHPASLDKKLDILSRLLGSASAAEALLTRNPMVLAMDARTNLAPKLRYLQSLYPEHERHDFVNLLAASDASAGCLSAAFSQLGRLEYLRLVHPDLDLERTQAFMVSTAEEMRRRYPGYENFLEERIEPRFPNYTWEQLCAVPFSSREQAHGEILYGAYGGPLFDEEGEASHVVDAHDAGEGVENDLAAVIGQRGAAEVRQPLV